MPIFKGSGVALVTPMNSDESVNYDKLNELIEYHVNNKTDAIIIVGTTGEGSTLSEEEHVECIKKAVEFTKGRIPVVAGTGSNSTATAKLITEEAEKAGADAALVVSPYYNKASQNGLVKHFSEIADSCKFPVILYNVPGRTGVTIQPQTIATLVKTKENIVGVKEASGDFAAVAKTMNLLDGKVELYSGEDAMVVPLLSMGGTGVISVTANIIPKETHDMCELFFNGDVEGAARIQREVVPIVEAMFCEVNPIPVKEAMNMLGFDVGPLRLPLCEMADSNKEFVKKVLKDFKLL